MESRDFSEGFATVKKRRQRHGGKRSVYPSQGFAAVKKRRQWHMKHYINFKIRYKTDKSKRRFFLSVFLITPKNDRSTAV